jgi:PKD domain-containing protein
MPRRAPIRLLRLLACAFACAVPVASAQAAPPPNDIPTTAQEITNLGWTSLSVPQDIVVQTSDWGDATTGPEDSDPLPSCTGTTGFRSMWYKISVPEAAVLRVTVASTDNARYQPVVTVLDPNKDEVGCGIASTARTAATANATAYVTPTSATEPSTYLVRVAQASNSSPSGGLPTLTVRFAGRDVTPPHIIVQLPPKTVAPGTPTPYDASATTDGGSGIDFATATWEFHDKSSNKVDIKPSKRGLQVTYIWRSEGTHDVIFRVKDLAGNESFYRFTTLVHDSLRPDVRFSLRPPMPGARRLRITVHASESVHVRLLVTQAGRTKPLLRRYVNFWGDREQARSVPLLGAVRKGLLVISGFARDLAGNVSALPQCVIDPVSGQGRCTPP